MIKVNYDGYGIYRRTGSNHVNNNVEWLYDKSYSLHEHDIKRLKDFGSVSIRALRDTDVEKLTVILTDEQGNPAPIEITKGVVEYRPDNGNKLSVYFDDAPLDDVEPAEKPLGERERNTLLKMIISMAIDGYGYNPNDEKSEFTGNGANSLKAMMLAKTGMELSDATIRKHLKAAAQLLPQTKQD